MNTAILDQLHEFVEQGKISERDKAFATDLVTKGRKYGLSEGQARWVGILVERVTNPPAVRVVGDFSGVYALFQKARQHLKFPKVILQTKAGHVLKVYISGPRSAQPDTLNVTDGAKYTENNIWFGRVGKDGTWVPSFKAPKERLKDAEDILKRLGANPEKVAAEYGKLTGNCCFCSRTLDDARSTAVGYGPVCAKNFGLKWGNK